MGRVFSKVVVDVVISKLVFRTSFHAEENKKDGSERRRRKVL